ncbi:MAG: ribosome biogenesis GTP-binding protein YihA/YsxC [Acholeplasmatales bacterium]|jgi:GTP-binding protein|nr:ribosome biogenesis GTP-binding protein YihA/YsxC [Acholeplasmatales bacterium]
MAGLFVKSFVSIEDLLFDHPQLLVMGRSNVGKSSLINAITKQKSVARISKTPGKTTTFNYYLVDNKYYLVDSPGYGYAKRSKTDKERFLKMLNSYLKSRISRSVFLLVDFLVGPTKDDLYYFEILKKLDVTVYVIATKYDKISSSNRKKRENEINSLLYCKIYPISVLKKVGFEALNELIEEIIK